VARACLERQQPRTETPDACADSRRTA
jgi:hypothetical protein